ncbi:DUF5829 family protein [Flavobacterium sp.]|uniref:DUF5829 family protein n=1 Tax=Flavobacterium sp. TaxID=239 RepID=UPI003750707F
MVSFKYVILLVTCIAFSQNKTVKLPIDLNTIFVTIDTDSYVKLFENSFVKDTLFLCKNVSNKTDKEDYSGKYFIGNSATIEFFSPMNTTLIGDTFGDVGIEFKTQKLNQLQLFKNKTTKTDLTTVIYDSIKLPYYESLTLKKTIPNIEISLLEYQKEYLSNLGFTADQINTQMTFSQFNSIVSKGKKYPRKFNKIIALELNLEKKEFSYLKEALTQFGAILKNKTFKMNEITIKCSIKRKEHFRVKKIKLSLLENVKTKETIISEKIKIKTKDKEAEILFSYP